jgi:hypothetical protein
MVEHSPMNIHIGAFAWFINIIEHGPIPIKVLFWGLKGFDMCQLVKDLNMTILKWLDQLAQHCPNPMPLIMWYCLVGNVGCHVLLMWATNQVVVVTTS